MLHNVKFVKPHATLSFQNVHVKERVMVIEWRIYFILFSFRFKMKVGGDIEDDIRRAKIFRETIGYDRLWVSLWNIVFRYTLKIHI